MKAKDLLLHLRLPFSFFLLPIFLFALSQAQDIQSSKAWWIFFILHFLVYPASNAYNSYFDKDNGPIGGLKNPPKTDKSLFTLAVRMEGLAFLLAIFMVHLGFGIGCFLYSLVSRAYSYDKIRLKKYPWLSWFIVGLFQGSLTFLLTVLFVGPLEWENSYMLGAVASATFLWAVYPITQVYQHKQDEENGDLTLSRLLGIRHTFYFTSFFLIVGSIFYFLLFTKEVFLLFLLINLPTTLFFLVWIWQVHKDETKADFSRTMLFNLLASLCLNVFFMVMLLK